jgi:hypothetical protein
VKHSQRPTSAKSWIDGAVIANGMHTVGGCTLPGKDAAMITADIVAGSNVGSPTAAPTSEIGTEMATPAA